MCLTVRIPKSLGGGGVRGCKVKNSFGALIFPLFSQQPKLCFDVSPTFSRKKKKKKDMCVSNRRQNCFSVSNELLLWLHVCEHKENKSGWMLLRRLRVNVSTFVSLLLKVGLIDFRSKRLITQVKIASKCNSLIKTPYTLRPPCLFP